MKRLSALVLLILAAPGIAALVPRERLAFEPSEGLSLTESYDQSWEIELVDMDIQVIVNGEEQEQEVPDVEVVIASVDHIVYTDEYLTVEDGEPRKVRRTFDELSSTSSEKAVDPEGEEHSEEKDGESELEGEIVVFTWDADDEEFAAEYEGEGADEDLLEDLNVVPALALFMPDDDLSEGDTWEIDVDAFNKLSSPGGDLAILEDDDEDDSAIQEQFEENLEGDLSGELQEAREVDGTELAVIRVTASLTTSAEETEALDFGGSEGTVTQTFDIEFELEGELLWNVEENRPHALELKGDVTLAMETQQEVSGERGDLEIVQGQTFEGQIEFVASVE